MIKTSLKGLIMILLSSVCFSIGAIFIKLVYAEGLSPLTIALVRMLIASLLLAPLYLRFALKFRISWKTHLALFVLGGIINAGVSLILTFALQVLSASITILLLYLYPVFTAVIASLFLKERITFLKVLALTGALAGVVLIVYVPRAVINMKGVFLAIIAAVIYAIMMVAIKKAVTGVPPLVSSAAMLTWGGVTMLVTGAIFQVPVFSVLTVKRWDHNGAGGCFTVLPSSFKLQLSLASIIISIIMTTSRS